MPLPHILQHPVHQRAHRGGVTGEAAVHLAHTLLVAESLLEEPGGRWGGGGRGLLEDRGQFSRV